MIRRIDILAEEKTDGLVNVLPWLAEVPRREILQPLPVGLGGINNLAAVGVVTIRVPVGLGKPAVVIDVNGQRLLCNDNAREKTRYEDCNER
jgi:hypothetical protein